MRVLVVPPSPTQISIAVVESDERFLIGQRPVGVPLEGLWEFPGGKVEAGETLEAAAIRECLEEAGIEIQVDGTYPTHRQFYGHGEVELHFFKCRPSDPNRQPREPFRWVARQDLSGVEFPRGNDQILATLIQDRLS